MSSRQTDNDRGTLMRAVSVPALRKYKRATGLRGAGLQNA